MRPSAKRGRAQRKCKQYLDVLTVHSYSPGISRWRVMAFFDRRALGGLLQIKMDTAIPPRYRRIPKKGRF